MILSIIIATVSMLGLGYVMYTSTSTSTHNEHIPEQPSNSPPAVGEGEADKMLSQLMDHVQAYEQYNEQKI